MTPDAFPLVFRHNSPRGFKGRRARILSHGDIRFLNGVRVYNAGDNTVALEFEDGTRLAAVRSAVVAADSRLGRQAVAKVARGGTLKRDWDAARRRTANGN